MPGMPRAVLRTPLDTLTREGGSQGANGRIPELLRLREPVCEERLLLLLKQKVLFKEMLRHQCSQWHRGNYSGKARTSLVRGTVMRESDPM